MADENKLQIIIKKSYFDNIQTVITSIDSFFASNFTKKDFPFEDGDFQLDSILMNLLSWFNNLEPSWCTNDEILNQEYDQICLDCEDIQKPNDNQSMYEYLIETNNTKILDKLNAYIAYEMMHDVMDNFEAFEKLVNSIYTFELFTKPSAYKDIIDLFSKQVYLSDKVKNIVGDTHISIFDTEKYVTGVFANTQIQLPDTLKQDTETTRMQNCTDLQNAEVIVDDRVEEAATTAYFKTFKPVNIKYDAKRDEFLISAKYKTDVDKMISELRKCNTSEDLIQLFSDEKSIMSSMIEWCSANVSPFVLNKVYNSEKKFPISVPEEAHKGIDAFMEAYNKKADSNPGAKRFINYDLFTTFKVDKEGTLKFLRDFLTIDLYNYKKATITNNTLLTLFNIFDSRVYLDSLYNLISDKDKKTNNITSEDAFVKDVRSRINANSRAVNMYNNSASDKLDQVKTSSEVMEYVSEAYQELGDLTTADMQYCEQYHKLLNTELACLNDMVHNECLSPIKVDKFMEGTYEVIQEGLIVDFFHNRKLKQVHKLEEEAGVKFSEEYLDILSGKLKIETFVINTSIRIYHLFARLNSKAELEEFNNALVDIRSSASVPASLKSKLYPIGILRFSYALPEMAYPIIASDDTGAVYVVQGDKFYQIAQNIREFVRVIVTEPIKITSISDYSYTPSCTTNTVSVSFPKNGTYAANLCAETLYMADSGRGWGSYVTRVFYPNLSAYCVKYLGFNGKIDRTVRLDGSITTTIAPFNSADVFKIVNRAWVNDSDSRKSHMVIGIGWRCSEKNTIIGTVDCTDGVPVKYNLGNVMSSPQSIMGTKPELFDHSSPELQCDEIRNSVDTDGLADTVIDNEPTQFDDFKQINESFIYIQEFDADVNGEIPEYMKTRIKLSDDDQGSRPSVGHTDINMPPDTPENDIDDLCGSINNRLNCDGDLSDMLGSAAKVEPNKGGIVLNITNNYSNSFNKNSNNTSDDHSTGKTTTTTTTTNNTNSHNDSSTNKKTTVDSSTLKKSIHKNTNSDTKPDSNSNSGPNPNNDRGTNNYNNSNDFVDTKDSGTATLDDVQTFATGHTVQEMFAFLESEEPLSIQEGAGNPPKQDILTTAMDKDRESLSGRQALKKGTQKVYNTGRAILKPITRTKQQLAKVVNSLIKRDEDKVKAEIIENPSYRSSLFKASRLALSVGAFGVLTTINGYLGAAYAVRQVQKLSDKHRLQKEVQSEFKAEIDILNKRIEKAEQSGDMKKMAELMRIRNKMQDMIGDSTKQKIKSRYSVY